MRVAFIEIRVHDKNRTEPNANKRQGYIHNARQRLNRHRGINTQRGNETHLGLIRGGATGRWNR